MASKDKVNYVKDPADLYFFTRTGTVAGSRNWSETHVSTSGGGGYLHNGTGHVSAPTTSSSTVTRGRFFIVEDNGDETSINSSVPVRDGQRIIVAWAGDSHSERGYMMGIDNRSTRDRHIFTGQFTSLNGAFRPGWLLVGAVVVNFVPFLGLFIGIPALIALLIFAFARFKKINDAINQGLNAALDRAVNAEKSAAAGVAAS